MQRREKDKRRGNGCHLPPHTLARSPAHPYCHPRPMGGPPVDALCSRLLGVLKRWGAGGDTQHHTVPLLTQAPGRPPRTPTRCVGWPCCWGLARSGESPFLQVEHPEFFLEANESCRSKTENLSHTPMMSGVFPECVQAYIQARARYSRLRAACSRARRTCCLVTDFSGQN